MRILHTADWHVGRKLGRIDRQTEFEQVLDELVAIAKDQKVDLVLVAGDLLDRAMPPLDAVRLALETLMRLADVAGNVVAIPGNHDSAALFGLLSPLVGSKGVHLVPRISRPREGGIIRVPSREGSEIAEVAVLPFLHEAEVIEFMAASEDWYKSYADRVRLLCKVLCDSIDGSSIGILMGHFFVDGAELGGGERRIHIGPQYAATPQAIPPGVQYAALGHVHRPQKIAGVAAGVPARYSGSLLQLDFSERTHSKEVAIVDAAAGRPARVQSLPLVSGRRLVRAEGTIDSLEARAQEFGDAYLDVRVKTAGPVFGLTEQVRAFLPNALGVQAVYERTEPEGVAPAAGRPLNELYADFYAIEHGVKAPAELIETFRSLEEDLERAAP